MAKKMMIANWKMHLTIQEAQQYLQYFLQHFPYTEAPINILFCPPLTHIATLQKMMPAISSLYLGAQNCHHQAQGAFTGEVSAYMLKDMVTHVLVGHSERRKYAKETDDILKKKIDLLLSYKLQPIFCCGEPMVVRQHNQHISFIQTQINTCLGHLSPQAIQRVVIAYEPIWAIGTGQAAHSVQIQTMHQAIRSILQQQYGPTVAQNISLVYGGSCHEKNAAEIFSCQDVDGGLIGSAALDVEKWIKIGHILAAV